MDRVNLYIKLTKGVCQEDFKKKWGDLWQKRSPLPKKKGDHENLHKIYSTAEEIIQLVMIP